MIESSVRVEGIGIRYLEQGQGPVVLLLHGATLGFSADVWRRNMAPLAARGYRVIAFDQPGYGLSDDPPDFAPSYRQQFITKFMDALDIPHAVVVGHSQSGGFAVSAALNMPQRFRGVVVVGTGSLLPPVDRPGREHDSPEAEPTLDDARRLLESNLCRHELITPAVLAEYHRMCIARNFTNALRRANAGTAKKPAGAATPLWQRLGEVQVPLLMVYGANDRGYPAERVALAHERYPTLPIHLFQHCHHLVQWDCDEEFVRHTVEFMKEISNPG